LYENVDNPDAFDLSNNPLQQDNSNIDTKKLEFQERQDYYKERYKNNIKKIEEKV